jgi:hypothetical protein
MTPIIAMRNAGDSLDMMHLLMRYKRSKSNVAEMEAVVYPGEVRSNTELTLRWKNKHNWRGQRGIRANGNTWRG